MAIEPVVDSLDKVAEPMRGEYEARDGKFHLKLTAPPPGYVSKSAHDEFRETNLALKREREQLAADLERFKGIDPDKAREAQAELQKLGDKQLIDEGKVDELVNARLERRQADFLTREKELTEQATREKGEREKLWGELSTRIVHGELDGLALKAPYDVLPGALRFVHLLAEHGDETGVRWQLDASRKAIAVKADGSPAYSAKDTTKPLEMGEWVESVIKANPQIQKPNTGAGGTGSNYAAGSGARIDPSLPAAERLRLARRVSA